MKFDEARKIYNDLKKFEGELPVIVTEMGAIGQNHFVKSFRDQGFEDSSVEKWQPRKRDDRDKRPRAILVKSGALRRSIRKTRQGKFGVTLVSDLPYAKVHNEGLEINKGARESMVYFREKSTNLLTGKANKVFASKSTRSRSMRATSGQKVTIGAHAIKMPKRQFMGYSKNMNVKIERMINRHVRKVFNE